MPYPMAGHNRQNCDPQSTPRDGNTTRWQHLRSMPGAILTPSNSKQTRLWILPFEPNVSFRRQGLTLDSRAKLKLMASSHLGLPNAEIQAWTTPHPYYTCVLTPSLCVCLCPIASARRAEVPGSQELELQVGWATWHRCWELHSSPRQEQRVILTWSLLSSLRCFLWLVDRSWELISMVLLRTLVQPSSHQQTPHCVGRVFVYWARNKRSQ